MNALADGEFITLLCGATATWPLTLPQSMMSLQSSPLAIVPHPRSNTSRSGYMTFEALPRIPKGSSSARGRSLDRFLNKFIMKV
jgi:hypothetical protein